MTTNLTPEAVAQHDQPTGEQARAHAERYPVKPGAPAGWWVAVDDGYPRLIALSPWAVGAYPGYTDWRPCDQRGTPVRPDGSDLPTVDDSGLTAERRAIRDLAERYAASEPPGRQGEAFRRFRVALAWPELRGPDGGTVTPAPVHPTRIHLDPATAIAQARHAYENAYHGRIGDQRAFAEGLLGPIVRALESLADFRAKWAELDGNSPGYSLQKARCYGAQAAALKKDLEMAEVRAAHEREQAAADNNDRRIELLERIVALESTINRALLLVPAWAPEHGGDIEQAVRGLVERLVYERDERFRLGGEIQHAITMLEEPLGERQASVVEGVRALTEALKLHADEMACQLAKARAQGRAEERAAIVAGVEHLKRLAETSIKRAEERGDESESEGFHAEREGYENVLAALANGEWSAGEATRASQAHAIVEAWERGALAQREAIVAGVKQELDELRAEKSYFGPMEQAWTAVYARLTAGEWSAKP